MATGRLTTNTVAFLDGGSANLATLTATADVITFSSAGGSVELIGLAAPTASSSATTKNYVDNLVNGLVWIAPVIVATTAAGTLATSFADGQTVDGQVLVTGQRILIKDQASGIENGVYTVEAAGAPTRTSDMATGSDASGKSMFVQTGTVNGDNAFVCTNDTGTGVVGTDALVFVQFSGAGQIEAGAALEKVGNVLNVLVDDSSIEIVADQLQVKASGITNAMLLNDNLDVVAGNGLSTTAQNILLGGSSTLSIDTTITMDLPSVQTATGAKTFSAITTVSNATATTSSTDGALVVTGGVGIGGDTRVAGTSYALDHISTSDERKKEDISAVEDATEIVKSLTPSFFKWKARDDERVNVGLIAQAVEEIIPDAVHTDATGGKAVNYNHIFALLLRSHQQLVDEVAALKAQ